MPAPRIDLAPKVSIDKSIIAALGAAIPDLQKAARPLWRMPSFPPVPPESTAVQAEAGFERKEPLPSSDERVPVPQHAGNCVAGSSLRRGLACPGERASRAMRH